MAELGHTERTLYHGLPPAPFHVDFLQQYAILIRQFQRLLQVAEASACGLDQFLAIAEYRYMLYLDLLASNAEDELEILPPWDVAIIWHTHLIMPLPYAKDVLYRPVYSQIRQEALDFPVAALANLVENNDWSEPISMSVWLAKYPNIEHQLWNEPPLAAGQDAELTLHEVTLPCIMKACEATVVVSMQEFMAVRAAEQSVRCNGCCTSMTRTDICFANLRRDWAVLLGDGLKGSNRAIKGTIINNNRNFCFDVEQYANLIRAWAATSSKLLNESESMCSVDEALASFDSYGAFDSPDVVATLRKDIRHAYTITISPIPSINLPFRATQQRKFIDQIMSSTWLHDQHALFLAIERYQRLQKLRQKGWELSMLPDIQLVHWAHRMQPSLFYRYWEDHIGERIVARSPHGKPRNGNLQELTEILWQEEFGESLFKLEEALSTAKKDKSRNMLSNDHLLQTAGTIISALNIFRSKSTTDMSIGVSVAEDDICDHGATNVRQQHSAPGSTNALYQEPILGSALRLLQFSHTCSKGRLHYSLKTYDVEAKPRYVAISYVWGQPYLKEQDGTIDFKLVEDRKIYCNDIELSLTANAYAVLKWLSVYIPATLLWIDCLCINQQDKNEKSAQVQRMDTVYLSAAYVLIWLGPEHRLLDDFRWACTTLRIRCQELQKTSKKVPPLNDVQSWTAAGHADAVRRFRNAVLFSAICRWFDRTWVVQEAVLATRIEVLCGSTLLPWFGIAWLGLQFHTFRPLSPDAILPEKLALSQSIGRRVWHMQTNRVYTGDPSAFNWAASTDTGRFVMSLMELLQLFRSTECFDSRDKVYAMLGIVRRKVGQYMKDLSISGSIRVDYGKMTWQEVYYAVAKLAIDHLDSLVLLNSVQMAGIDDDPQLPSWVPDLSRFMNITPIHQRSIAKDPFRVWPKKQLANGNAKVDEKRLMVKGIKIDDIQPEKFPSHPPLLGLLQLAGSTRIRNKQSSRIEALVSALTMRDITRKIPGWSPSVLKQAFCALVQDSFSTAIREYQDLKVAEIPDVLDQISDILQHYQDEVRRSELPTLEILLETVACKAIAKSKTASEEEKRTAAAALIQIEQLSTPPIRNIEQMRALFETRGGTLGIGPISVDDAAGTDEVWMLASADVPFILRRVKHHDAKEWTFKLLGDCYLHECMHGQILEDNPNLIERLQNIVLV